MIVYIAMKQPCFSVICIDIQCFHTLAAVLPYQFSFHLSKVFAYANEVYAYIQISFSSHSHNIPFCMLSLFHIQSLQVTIHESIDRMFKIAFYKFIILSIYRCRITNVLFYVLIKIWTFSLNMVNKVTNFLSFSFACHLDWPLHEINTCTDSMGSIIFRKVKEVKNAYMPMHSKGV